MKITAEWLWANRTEAGGWTMRQLDAIGVPWPPRQGWKRKLIGQEISDVQRDEFEQDAGRERYEKRGARKRRRRSAAMMF